MKIRHTLLVTLTLVTIVAFAACGGGEKPALTIQEYTDAMIRLQDEFKEEYKRISNEVFAKILGLGIEIRTEIYSEEASEESIDDASGSFEDSYQEALNDYLSEAIQILTVYRDGLNDLRPPPDMENLHKEWELAIEAEIEILATVDIDVLSESEGDLPEIGGNRDQFETSCEALEEALETEPGRLALCYLFDLGLGGGY